MILAAPILIRQLEIITISQDCTTTVSQEGVGLRRKILDGILMMMPVMPLEATHLRIFPPHALLIQVPLPSKSMSDTKNCWPFGSVRQYQSPVGARTPDGAEQGKCSG